MSTASTAANNAGETAKEAIREARKAASAASGNLEADLQALRDEFAKLADQVAGPVNAAWRRAKASIDDAVAEAEDKGREAASAVCEVSGHFVDAIDESIKTRPYTTLAIVAGIAFLFGATWRR